MLAIRQLQGKGPVLIPRPENWNWNPPEMLDSFWNLSRLDHLSRDSTVVEHLPHHPEVEGLSPATATVIKL